MSSSRIPNADGAHKQPQSLQPAGNGWLVDLLVIAILTVCTAGLLWVEILPQYVVWIIGVPFVVFYPGYAMIAALLPEKAPKLQSGEVEPSRPPTRLSRVALAIVISPALLGVLAIVLSPWNAIELQPLLMGITAITLAGLVIAAVRRLFLPPHIREGITLAEVKSWMQLSVPMSSRQNISLGLAVLLLIGVSTGAVMIPGDGEAYTEAYLLSETDGEYLTANLPTNVTVGETEEFHVGVENHENEQVTYELVTVFQQLDDEDEISAQEVQDSVSVTLADEEQAFEEQSFIVPDTAGEYRLQVFIFENELPDEPTADDADHVLQLEVTVASNED